MATDPYKAWDAKQANKKFWQDYERARKNAMRRSQGHTMDPGQRAARRLGIDPNTGLGLGEANRSGYYPGKVRGFFETIPRDHRPATMPKVNRSAGNVGETRTTIPPVPFPTGRSPSEIRTGHKRYRGNI